MAAAQLCEAQSGGAHRLSFRNEAVRSSAELPRKCGDTRWIAKATGKHRFAIRTAVRETLSLSGPWPAGIHVCDSAGATCPPDPTPFPNAPCTRWNRSRRNLEQEGES